MSMIFCKQCQNEYDNHNPTCPYCGSLTSHTSAFREKLPALLIIGTIIATFGWMHYTDNSEELTLPSFSDITSRFNISDNTEQTNNSTSITESQPTQQFAEGEMLLQYIQAINNQLQIPALSGISRFPDSPEIDATTDTFSHALNEKAFFTVTFNNIHTHIVSVEIRNNSTRRNSNRTIANFAAIALSNLPTLNVPLDTAQAQISYLNQLAQTHSQNCSTYYAFENIYLAQEIDRSQRTTISFLTHPPTNACN